MSSPVEERRQALLALAASAGIRLRNLPEHPSSAWLDRAERRVKEAIAKREAGLRERRDALIERAATARIKLRNVPEQPSAAWLDKAESRVEEIIKQRFARRRAEAVDNPRLASLMARARSLGVRLRKVPESPSERWLDRLEQKLTEIAREREEPAPPDPAAPEVDATSVADPRATVDGLPATVEVPQPAAVDLEADEQRAIEERVAELIARAERAGLDLGRVPPNPTEDWVVSTAAALESVLEERREARRAERTRRTARRRERMKTLFALAEQHDVRLDPIPAFPTEDWIGRAELMVYERAYADEDEGSRRDRLQDQRRRERLAAILERAERGGFDIGSIPPDPDEEWLDEAESRVAGREEEASEVLEAESAAQPDVARLVYEADTLQEEVKPLDSDEMTIGRNRSNPIQVRNDAQVSRKHARLWVVDGVWYVADLGSTRGTQVNGATIDGDQVLRDGDELQVGETRFLFQLPS